MESSDHFLIHNCLEEGQGQLDVFLSCTWLCLLPGGLKRFPFVSHVIIHSEVWEHMPLIPDLRMCRQEDPEFRGNIGLDYGRSYLTQTTKTAQPGYASKLKTIRPFLFKRFLQIVCSLVLGNALLVHHQVQRFTSLVLCTRWVNMYCVFHLAWIVSSWQLLWSVSSRICYDSYGSLTLPVSWNLLNTLTLSQGPLPL